MIHNISYRAFVYGTENKEKVLESIKTLFPNSSPQCEATEGYYKNPGDLKKKVQKSQRNADIIMVRGGDLKVNRAACEERSIDILSQPYRSRRDTGINHILAKKAAENNVAIEINLKTLLNTNLRYRYRIISQFRHIVGLQRKFNFPLIISSNANSKYDLKTPRDIIALAKCFGMTFEESFDAISRIPKDIIETNNKRDSFIVDGVRTVE